MGLWFLSNPALLKRERDAFDQLKKNEDWLVGLAWSLKDGLCVDAVIRAHEHDYKVKLVYPAYFPDTPPAVYPQETDRRWSMHQYGDKGSLCLEWGPDNWIPEVTGADLIKSAYKLLSIENPLGNQKTDVMPQAPSRHKLEMGQELRNKPLRCLITRELRDFLNKIDDQCLSSIKFSNNFHTGSWVVMFHQVEVPGQPAWMDPRIPVKKDQYPGIFIKAGAYKEPLKNLDKIEDLLKIGISKELIAEKLKEIKKETLGLLVLNGLDEAMFFFITDDDKIYSFGQVVEDPGQNRTPEGQDILINKKVCIVGLGSLGSKIAVILARSGIRNFYFVDYDLFMPDNIKRHVLNWEHVGADKLDAVRDLLSKIDKNITVDFKSVNLTGQESSAYLDVCLSKMSSCDLVIDATADERVFNLLSSVARNEQKKFLWATVFEGGRGGQIARYIPATGKLPQLVRAAYNEFCFKNPSPVVKTAERYLQEDAEGKVLVASDADVSVIADNAARFAIDAILETYEYEYPMYLIGMGKWWVFKSPLEVIPIDCGPVPAMTIDQKVELDEEGKKFIMGLTEGAAENESNPS